MGQKVNPVGLRLGINRTWDSRWYADSGYGALLHEDLDLRAFLRKRLSQAGVEMAPDDDRLLRPKERRHRLLQRDLAVGKAGAHRLDRAGVFANSRMVSSSNGSPCAAGSSVKSGEG